jgi:hypothetical protein
MDTEWGKSKERAMSSRRNGTKRTEFEGAAAQAGAGNAVSADPQPVHEIRLRAYEIYIERGEQPGRELDDWLEAERQLKSDPH